MKVTLPWNLRSTTVTITLTSTTYSEGIHRYTKNTSIFTYFDSVGLLLEINSPGNIPTERKCCIYKSVHFIVLLTGGRGNYPHAQQQVDGLFCNHWKRFKKINLLIGLPASSTLPSTTLLRVDFHTTARMLHTNLSQNRSPFDSKTSSGLPISLKIKPKSSTQPTRPYSVVSATSLTSSQTL